MIKLNISRYRELLAKTKSSTKKGKDYFNDPTVLELLSFKASVETQVFYNHKNKYFALIQTYLGGIINPNVFRGEFITMVNEDLNESQKLLDNLEELSTFWVDLELDDFSSLFGKMHETCLYAFEFEYEDDAMPEDKFRDSILKIFTQMQSYENLRVQNLAMNSESTQSNLNFAEILLTLTGLLVLSQILLNMNHT